MTWELGGTGETLSHAFAEPGTYEVRARASDGRVAMRTVTVAADTGLPPAVTELDAARRRSPPAVPRGSARPAFDPDGGPLTFAYDLDGDGAFDDDWTTGAGRSPSRAR